MKKISKTIIIFAALGCSLSVYAKASYIPSHLEKFEKTNVCVNCDLSEANFEFSNHTNANLTGSLLNKAKMYSSKFYTSNFNGAKIMYSDLTDIQASGSSFNGANLAGVDFDGANLTSCNFSGANVSGANFKRANLANSNITEEQLASAKSLSCAILPDGTRHPADNGSCY